MVAGVCLAANLCGQGMPEYMAELTAPGMDTSFNATIDSLWTVALESEGGSPER